MILKCFLFFDFFFPSLSLFLILRSQGIYVQAWGERHVMEQKDRQMNLDDAEKLFNC